MSGAGSFGSTGVVAVDARLPCSFLLKPFASLIICGDASVVSNAFTNLVDKAFRPLKAATLSFTLLLYAVFLVTTSARLACDEDWSVISWGNFKAFFEGL